MKPRVKSNLNKELRRAYKVIKYYANPETYFAIGFFPDPPCGDFMKDFSETDLGLKPGKKARKFLYEKS